MTRPASPPPALSEHLYTVLSESRKRGFLGRGDPQVHIRHALGFASAIGADVSVVDLGSGGGVPGLPLLVYRPDIRMALLDSARRRIDFLRGALSALSDVDRGIEERSEVLWGRAEDLPRDGRNRGGFDVVVARSFGRPAVVAECARPFLRSRGRLIVSEPPVVDEQRWPSTPLASLGLRKSDSYRFDGSGFVVLEAVGDCPESLPRRTGVVHRRPAF